MDHHYADANKDTIKQGDRVWLAGPDPEANDYGTILSISDPDGDVNTYGRPVAIPPAVTVKFDDGGDDTFPCNWAWFDRNGGLYVCEDIIKTGGN